MTPILIVEDAKKTASLVALYPKMTFSTTKHGYGFHSDVIARLSSQSLHKPYHWFCSVFTTRAHTVITSTEERRGNGNAGLLEMEDERDSLGLSPEANAQLTNVVKKRKKCFGSF